MKLRFFNLPANLVWVSIKVFLAKLTAMLLWVPGIPPIISFNISVPTTFPSEATWAKSSPLPSNNGSTARPFKNCCPICLPVVAKGFTKAPAALAPIKFATAIGIPLSIPLLLAFATTSASLKPATTWSASDKS